MADFVNVEYGGNHPIDIATMNGNVEVVKVLVQHGADLSLKGQNGQTPLHLSAWKGNAEVGEVLLRAGECCAPQTSQTSPPRPNEF